MTHVEPADLRDDAVVEVAAHLMTEVWDEVLGYGAQPATTFAEMDDWLRNPPEGGEVLLWLATDGDEPVGFAALDVRTGHGNDHRAWVSDLWVRPTHRRRGIGRSLLDEVVKAARDRDRSIVHSGHQVPHAGAEGFAESVGAVAELADDQNRVTVADLDRPMLESWAAPAPGYSIVAWDDPCPDELLEPFARLQDVMNTAPSSSTVNPQVVTPEMVRDSERRVRASGGERWIVAARHDQTGELAGYTELVFKPYHPWLARQGDTGVAVAHRGNGLGRLVKAVNALRLLDERSEVQVIETWNASTNGHMLAINHAMGFRRVSQWREVELGI